MRTGEDAPKRGARGDGGDPHKAFTMEGTDVRALWFTCEPAGIRGKLRPAGDRGGRRLSRVS
ncbi:hypothetical protein GCM10023084_42970 [Streptomyces lacrimifluminis]|uniref:Uncharacterized protein n=1 Tax=Streptomyces lacrimifluminis TaxID=1500077 RepID=A0A917NMP3_9ACTN|nr:hypothetical protein GCM10012282_05560 [Streptomyces lacrimifluminis]